jgi:hypothetical protein
MKLLNLVQINPIRINDQGKTASNIIAQAVPNGCLCPVPYSSPYSFFRYLPKFSFHRKYFKKQGFSMDITLDKALWMGYIKDYEGGTIMQCKMLDKVNYLDVVNIILSHRHVRIANSVNIHKAF